MRGQPKHKKIAIGRIERWWNFLFIARKFEISTPEPADMVAQGLRSLQQLESRAYIHEGRLVRVETVDIRREYNFEVKLQKINEQGQPHTSATAIGRVIYSDGYEKTILRGIVRASPQVLVGLVITGVIIPLLLTGGGIMIFYTRVDKQSTTFALFIVMLVLTSLSGIFLVRYVYKQYLRDYKTIVGWISDSIEEIEQKHHPQEEFLATHPIRLDYELLSEIPTSHQKGIG